MSRTDLQVVTFAVPHPPDYGGAIDVWNRLVALQAEGLRLSVHAFVYGRFMPSRELEALAVHTEYYPRSLWPALFERGLPYTVTSRKDKRLLENLRANPAPVFFEGIQTTGWCGELPDHRLLLRAHNIEHQYYARLSDEARRMKGLVFAREARCLESYERTWWPRMHRVFAISPSDTAWLAQEGIPAHYLPPFHGQRELSVDAGRGGYVLYQGDLSIEINQRALLDLLQQLPDGRPWPTVVAGRSGDPRFERKIRSMPNLTRYTDVSQEQLIRLIKGAQVVIVHSLHPSGMKLKLFPALYHARFIAVSMQDLTNTALDEAFYPYSAVSLPAVLADLWQRPFTEADRERRLRILDTQPDDRAKAREIIRYL